MAPHVIHLIFFDITAFVYKSAKTEALCGPHYSTKCTQEYLLSGGDGR